MLSVPPQPLLLSKASSRVLSLDQIPILSSLGLLKAWDLSLFLSFNWTFSTGKPWFPRGLEAKQGSVLAVNVFDLSGWSSRSQSATWALNLLQAKPPTLRTIIQDGVENRSQLGRDPPAENYLSTVR